jgi:hypothetical protein
MGVFSVAMATLCLTFPLELWLYAVIGPVLMCFTCSVAAEGLPDNHGSGAVAACVSCGGLAVCAVFVMVGAGIMFEPDGADGNCTAYYDGFQYQECSSTLPEIAAEGEEGSIHIINTSSSSSSWGGG